MAQQTKEKKASPRYVYTGHEEFPKTNIKLTYQELEILFKQPSELMKLYMFLNLYRDFNTNITGETVHIDDTSFKLWVGYPSKTGRKGRKPSTTHIVRWLDQLEVLGLIQRRGNNVFYLPLAHLNQHDPKISHQGVTNLSPNNAQGVTKSNNDKTPINTEAAADNKKEVSPNNEGGVTEVVQRLYTIPDNTLHNITSHSAPTISPVDNSKPNAQDFFQLLAKQGYYINQLHGNKKTLAMVHAWVQAEVSLEEAQIGINHVNQQLGKTPDTPTYYNKPVLQVKSDFKNAQQLAQEITDATNRPRPITQSKADSRRNRYKKILR